MVFGIRSLAKRIVWRTAALFNIQAAPAPLSDAEIILHSSLFDEVWYRERYPLEAPSTLEAIQDYIDRAALDEIQPHPLFDGVYYSKQLAEQNMSLSGSSPLAHFIQYGADLGLHPNRLFDAPFYRSQLSEALPGYKAFRHFLVTGGVLSPHPAFDSTYYRSQRRDLYTVNPLTHFMGCGWREGLNPSAKFSVRRALSSIHVHKGGLNAIVDLVLQQAQQDLTYA